MFKIHRVQKSVAAAQEQLGTKYKFWYEQDGKQMLFKADDRGTGEDWAEKITSCLAGMLGLPHVNYELAHLYDGDKELLPGVICETCAPSPQSLTLGNELLMIFDRAYPGHQKGRVREHTVRAVSDAVKALYEPASLEEPPSNSNAIGAFVGYVMLDAWVANQDRHHENWGAIWNGATFRLAPTFDHGAALARNLTDSERRGRLATRDKNQMIEFFSSRARSAFYLSATDNHPLGTFEAFDAFASDSPRESQFWLGRLEKVSHAAVQRIIHQVPQSRMSDISKDFTLQLLLVNQKRLLKCVQR